MASKRKSEPVKKAVKRNKKKVDDDFESDLSDDFNESEAPGNGSSAPVTSFIEASVMPKLPDEILASRDREPGKLLMAGCVTWDIVGKRMDNSKGGIKIRPNLWNFHRFTDEKYRLVASGCASAHSVLINMDRKALTFGKSTYSCIK